MAFDELLNDIVYSFCQLSFWESFLHYDQVTAINSKLI